MARSVTRGPFGKGDAAVAAIQSTIFGNPRQAFHQKIRRAHPHLERAEGMLSRPRRRRIACGFLLRRC
jgi:hypothetical protein